MYATVTGETYGVAGGDVEPHEVTPEHDYAAVEDDYAASLIQGESQLDLEFVKNCQIVREHSSLSDFQIDIPADYDLEIWRNSDTYITYDGRLVFVGELERISSDEKSSVTTLSGRGIGTELESGDIQMIFSDTPEHRAIRDAWEHIAPGWNVTVIRPKNPIVIDEIELTGSPFDIITELHDEFGMRFAISHRERDTVMSFPRHRIVGTSSWTVNNRERSRDSSDYYNAAIVRGSRKPNGDRVEGYYEETEEIQERAAELGISEEDATILWTEIDPDLETAKACENRAKARIYELVRNGELGGTIDIFPRMLMPGISYTIDEWDDERINGPYALYFENGYVSLPPATLDRESGALTLWVKESSGAIVSTNSDFGISSTDVTVGAETVPIDTTDWTLIHVEWADDAFAIGTNGNLLDTFTADVSMVDDIFHVGETGYVDDIRIWEALPANFSVLNDQDEPYSWSLRNRWPLNESPYQEVDRVHDVYGRQHGTYHGDYEITGTPLSLETINYDVAFGSMSGKLHFEEPASLSRYVERLRREHISLKKSV